MKSILNKAVLCGCVILTAFAFAQNATQPAESAEPPSTPAERQALEIASEGIAEDATDTAETAEETDAESAEDADDVSQDVEFVHEETVKELTEEADTTDAITDADALTETAEAEAETDTDAEAEAATVEAAAAEQTAAEEPSGDRPRGETRLGLMRLESLTGHDKLAEELTGEAVAMLEALGLYEVYRPGDLDKALAAAKIRRPSSCRDPMCVRGIAKALGLRRMIFGTVDMNGQRAAVTLTLIDVSLSTPVESVSLEGAAGVPANAVLRSAVERLHGHASDLNVSKYYGPAVDNMNEFMWATIATQGVGLFYSVINYGVGGLSSASDVDYIPYVKEDLSGIPASANQIPMFSRPASLANAYTAVSDDAYGVLYNPAGMAWVAHREAALGFQHRFGMDIIAASYVNRATRDIGFGQALMLTTDRDDLMTELYFVTAAGYKVNRMPILGPLSAGMSLKLLGNTVKAKSPDSPRGQSFGIGVDLGLMWELSDRIRYGLHVRDIMSVNRWKNRTTGSTYSEWHPITLHMGGSYSAGYNTLLVADGQIPVYADQPWVMAGGIEYTFYRIFALRVGLQREIMHEESNWWKITGGGGLKFDIEPLWGKYINLDFAYEYSTLEVFPVFNVSVRVGF